MATSDNNQNRNTNNQSNNQSGTGNQGFASMDPERQREIASQGGKAAHAAGTAHEFTSEEAREAGSHSHDNDNSRSNESSSSGGSSSRSGGSNASSSSSGSSSGGSQQAEAGRQSHKSDANR